MVVDGDVTPWDGAIRRGLCERVCTCLMKEMGENNVFLTSPCLIKHAPKTCKRNFLHGSLRSNP